MVFLDNLTKFVVLHSLQIKSADEVVNHVLDILSLFGSPHILQTIIEGSSKRLILLR